MAQTPAIELKNVGRRFGALQAVRDVTFDVAVGERHAVLGPNGAGKTTLFNTICGDFPPTSGSIKLFGEEISHVPAHRRARRGIGRTYQQSLLFNGLSVRDNLFVAVRGVKPKRFSFLVPRAGDEHVAKAREVAERVRLAHVLDVAVGDASRDPETWLSENVTFTNNVTAHFVLTMFFPFSVEYQHPR
jgi:branched-chain amino acid transport system ATP-binding protein